MAIQIQHLNKFIGKQHVLKDICLTINDGEVVGLLGPNGAGKSTLMKIMVGVWDATNGEICHYVKAWQALRASADGSMIHNPSAISVFLSCGGNTVEIRPGETVHLW